MEPPDRDYFEKRGSAPAMDYAAVLIQVAGTMADMREELKTIGGKGAAKAFNRALNACRDAACALVLSATRVDPREKLESVRVEHLPELQEATKATLLLALNEQRAADATALFTKHAHAPLVALVVEWGGQPPNREALGA